MSRQKSTPKRRRQTKLEGKGEIVLIGINGQIKHTTLNPHLQDAVKVVLEKDVDWIYLSPVYADNKGRLIAHSNWLRDVPNIPDALTVIIQDGCLIEVIPENQDTWRRRYDYITNHGFANEKSIAYLEVKRNAIREMLGARS